MSPMEEFTKNAEEVDISEQEIVNSILADLMRSPLLVGNTIELHHLEQLISKKYVFW